METKCSVLTYDAFAKSRSLFKKIELQTCNLLPITGQLVDLDLMF